MPSPGASLKEALSSILSKNRDTRSLEGSSERSTSSTEATALREKVKESDIKALIYIFHRSVTALEEQYSLATSISEKKRLEKEIREAYSDMQVVFFEYCNKSSNFSRIGIENRKPEAITKANPIDLIKDLRSMLNYYEFVGEKGKKILDVINNHKSLYHITNCFSDFLMTTEFQVIADCYQKGQLVLDRGHSIESRLIDSFIYSYGVTIPTGLSKHQAIQHFLDKMHEEGRSFVYPYYEDDPTKSQEVLKLFSLKNMFYCARKLSLTTNHMKDLLKISRRSKGGFEQERDKSAKDSEKKERTLSPPSPPPSREQTSILKERLVMFSFDLINYDQIGAAFWSPDDFEFNEMMHHLTDPFDILTVKRTLVNPEKGLSKKTSSKKLSYETTYEINTVALMEVIRLLVSNGFLSGEGINEICRQEVQELFEVISKGDVTLLNSTLMNSLIGKASKLIVKFMCAEKLAISEDKIKELLEKDVMLIAQAIHDGFELGTRVTLYDALESQNPSLLPDVEASMLRDPITKEFAKQHPELAAQKLYGRWKYASRVHKNLLRLEQLLALSQSQELIGSKHLDFREYIEYLPFMYDFVNENPDSQRMTYYLQMYGDIFKNKDLVSSSQLEKVIKELIKLHHLELLECIKYTPAMNEEAEHIKLLSEKFYDNTYNASSEEFIDPDGHGLSDYFLDAAKHLLNDAADFIEKEFCSDKKGIHIRGKFEAKSRDSYTFVMSGDDLVKRFEVPHELKTTSSLIKSFQEEEDPIEKSTNHEIPWAHSKSSPTYVAHAIQDKWQYIHEIYQNIQRLEQLIRLMDSDDLLWKDDINCSDYIYYFPFMQEFIRDSENRDALIKLLSLRSGKDDSIEKKIRVLIDAHKDELNKQVKLLSAGSMNVQAKSTKELVSESDKIAEEKIKLLLKEKAASFTIINKASVELDPVLLNRYQVKPDDIEYKYGEMLKQHASLEKYSTSFGIYAAEVVKKMEDVDSSLGEIGPDFSPQTFCLDRSRETQIALYNLHRIMAGSTELISKIFDMSDFLQMADHEQVMFHLQVLYSEYEDYLKHAKEKFQENLGFLVTDFSMMGSVFSDQKNQKILKDHRGDFIELVSIFRQLKITGDLSLLNEIDIAKNKEVLKIVLKAVMPITDDRSYQNNVIFVNLLRQISEFKILDANPNSLLNLSEHPLLGVAGSLFKGLNLFDLEEQGRDNIQVLQEILTENRNDYVPQEFMADDPKTKKKVIDPKRVNIFRTKLIRLHQTVNVEPVTKVKASSIKKITYAPTEINLYGKFAPKDVQQSSVSAVLWAVGSGVANVALSIGQAAATKLGYPPDTRPPLHETLVELLNKIDRANEVLNAGQPESFRVTSTRYVLRAPEGKTSAMALHHTHQALASIDTMILSIDAIRFSKEVYALYQKKKSELSEPEDEPIDIYHLMAEDISSIEQAVRSLSKEDFLNLEMVKELMTLKDLVKEELIRSMWYGAVGKSEHQGVQKQLNRVLSPNSMLLSPLQKLFEEFSFEEFLNIQNLHEYQGALNLAIGALFPIENEYDYARVLAFRELLITLMKDSKLPSLAQYDVIVKMVAKHGLGIDNFFDIKQDCQDKIQYLVTAMDTVLLRYDFQLAQNEEEVEQYQKIQKLKQTYINSESKFKLSKDPSRLMINLMQINPKEGKSSLREMSQLLDEMLKLQVELLETPKGVVGENIEYQIAKNYFELSNEAMWPSKDVMLDFKVVLESKRNALEIRDLLGKIKSYTENLDKFTKNIEKHRISVPQEEKRRQEQQRMRSDVQQVKNDESVTIADEEPTPDNTLSRK